MCRVHCKWTNIQWLLTIPSRGNLKTIYVNKIVLQIWCFWEKKSIYVCFECTRPRTTFWMTLNPIQKFTNRPVLARHRERSASSHIKFEEGLNLNLHHKSTRIFKYQISEYVITYYDQNLLSIFIHELLVNVTLILSSSSWPSTGPFLILRGAHFSTERI